MSRQRRPAPRPVAGPNLIDRIVGYFDPFAGGRRALARVQLGALMGGAGGYVGGDRRRRSMKGWRTLGGSADEALIPDLDELRDRSHDLDRNAPLARGALNTIPASVIGTGLMVKPQIDRKALGLADAKADEIEAAMLREFVMWAGSTACDLRRSHTFADLQYMAFRSVLAAGDVFSPIRYRERPGEVYGLKVQLVEGARVDNPRHKADGSILGNGNRLVAGVELDADGAPVAYHFRDRYGAADRAARVAAGAAEWTRVAAFAPDGRRQVLHLLPPGRPEGTRGEPILAPIIETLRQLTDYSEAELTAAVVAGMFTVFVKSPTGQGIATAPTSGASTPTAAEANEEVGLRKGGIYDLAPGEEIETADPSRPNANFDPFVLALCRQIGVALELPYELLIKHFTSSYSASRAALLEAWRMYRRRRAWFVAHFCQPFYEALLREAVMRGRLDLDGFLTDPATRFAWCRASWRGPAPGQIDPDKEVTAAGKRIALRLSTRSRETAELTGEDWESVDDQLKAEERRVGAGGIVGGDDPAASAPPPRRVPVDDVDSDEEED